MSHEAVVPNARLLADESIPRVTLAGVEWPIPPLSIKQLEIVTPLAMTRIKSVAVGAEMGQDVIHDLATIVFQGLSRGHKELTREAFDDMEAGLVEIVEAAIVVAKQAGLTLAKSRSETNGVSRGEAVRPLESTGAGS